MCPLCIGSALLAVTGGSAGGLALIAARLVAVGSPKHPEEATNPTTRPSIANERHARTRCALPPGSGSLGHRDR